MAHAHAAMVQEAPLKIYARGVVSYFYFSRAPLARAENKANQQCHFKSSRWRIRIRKARIPTAEQFPWNLRCLTDPCDIKIQI
jgi:hypothetical protein